MQIPDLRATNVSSCTDREPVSLASLVEVTLKHACSVEQYTGYVAYTTILITDTVGHHNKDMDYKIFNLQKIRTQNDVMSKSHEQT